jgi:two-component system cell cycle response regulator
VTLTLTLFVIAFLCGALVAAALAVLRERRKVHELGEEVADLRDETALLERRDEATGLYNSRHFVEALTHEIERSRTYGRPLALALASVETRGDNDDFLIAEKTLRELGVAIGGSVRAIDMACRVGSTEYGVIMPETDTKAASVAAERVLRAVARAGSKGNAQPQAAVGIAACPAHAETFEELIERAGSALRSARDAVREESSTKPGTVTVSMAVWDDGEE